MSDAAGGDECLGSNKVIERPLRGVLRRMGDRAEGDAGALGEQLQWTELGADVGGLVAVEIFATAAHVTRDRIDRDEPYIIIPDCLFELVEVLGQQKHLVAIFAPAPFQFLDETKVCSGRR